MQVSGRGLVAKIPKEHASTFLLGPSHRDMVSEDGQMVVMVELWPCDQFIRVQLSLAVLGGALF